MKRIISIVCAFVLLIGTCLVTTAEETTENNYLYEDRFIKEYVKEGVRVRYTEEYYHYNENGEIDWCIIYATASNVAQTAAIKARIGDVIISSNNIIYPFDLKYAVYDVKNDKFVDLIDNYDELSSYDGLFDVLSTVDHSFIIGDGDKDGVLSIIDANIIQSALVGKIDLNISEYTDWRTHKSSNYYDVDYDGEFSVMDATAIQLKVAKK